MIHSGRATSAPPSFKEPPRGNNAAALPRSWRARRWRARSSTTWRARSSTSWPPSQGPPHAGHGGRKGSSSGSPRLRSATRNTTVTVTLTTTDQKKKTCWAQYCRDTLFSWRAAFFCHSACAMMSAWSAEANRAFIASEWPWASSKPRPAAFLVIMRPCLLSCSSSMRLRRVSRWADFGDRASSALSFSKVRSVPVSVSLSYSLTSSLSPSGSASTIANGSDARPMRCLRGVCPGGGEILGTSSRGAEARRVAGTTMGGGRGRSTEGAPSARAIDCAAAARRMMAQPFLAPPAGEVSGDPPRPDGDLRILLLMDAGRSRLE
mmetsp:Transcript_22199/g.69068  ORF Transcript_22199/g.69068 Transcript_22199/m.69068 type:complete len:321 (+) Transcript_22199:67-1029(+)